MLNRKPQTPMVRLRRFRARDVNALYEAVQESFTELSRFMGWCSPSYERAHAAAFVKKQAAAWKAKSEFALVVEDDGSSMLGVCGLNRIEWLSGTANLGYWVRTSATGRGVCSAAVAQVVKFAFRETKLHRLEIIVAIDNVASQRVAEKAGAIREGVLRQRLLAGDARHDAVLYSILRGDRERC